MRKPEHQLMQQIGRSNGYTASAALAAAFGFFVFLPYPAPFMGIQVGHVMGAGILAHALLLKTPLFAWRLLPLILVPSLLSATWVTFAGEGDSDIAWKVFVAFASSVLIVGATEALLRRSALPFFVGVAVAILLHAAVGAYQLYSFQNDELPFFELYVNPNFRSVQDDVERIARWSKRPFGIFPEPSAMAASVTPFVLLWIAGALQLVKGRDVCARNCRALFFAAAMAGLLLMLASRSGHSIIAVLGVIALFLQWAAGARMTATNLRRIALAALGLPIILWYGGTQLMERTGSEGRFDTESWRDRRGSIIDGVALVGERGPSTVIAGVGVGQGPRLIGRKTGADAIWSVLMNYFVETGLIGCICAMIAAGLIWWHVRRSPGLGVLMVIAVSWFVGVTVTTSYSSLLPLWASLAVICSWPALIASDAQRPAVQQHAAGSGLAHRSGRVPV